MFLSRNSSNPVSIFFLFPNKWIVNTISMFFVIYFFILFLKNFTDAFQNYIFMSGVSCVVKKFNRASMYELVSSKAAQCLSI